MEFKIENIVIDTVTKNGCKIPHEVIEKDIVHSKYIRDEIHDRTLPIEFTDKDETGFAVDIHNACGTITDIYIKENYLYVDINFFKIPGDHHLEITTDIDQNDYAVYMVGLPLYDGTRDDDLHILISYTVIKFIIKERK